MYKGTQTGILELKRIIPEMKNSLHFNSSFEQAKEGTSELEYRTYIQLKLSNLRSRKRKE